jgi:hypothetical protein
LLANTLLDEVDKELEKRGLAFCRYADDLNVYTRPKRAAKDAMQTLRELFSKLRLQVNESKSAVARPWERRFLGSTFWLAKKTGELKRGVARKSLEVMKDRVRVITSRTRGRSIPFVIAELRPYLLGWKEYVELQERTSLFRELDGWIRHRLRMLHLKHWKNGPNAYRELCARGLPELEARKVAGNLLSCGATRTWRSIGHCVRATSTASVCRGSLRNLNFRTPDADPHVRWCGRGLAGNSRHPYPDNDLAFGRVGPREREVSSAATTSFGGLTAPRENSILTNRLGLAPKLLECSRQLLLHYSIDQDEEAVLLAKTIKGGSQHNAHA